MGYQTFLRQLESNALPASEFDHQAHLYAAWAYRRQYPAPEAAARCAYSLSRFAMMNGEAMKYHHTLTMAILVLLYSRIEANPKLLDDWETLLTCCADLVTDSRAVLLEHYSAERLNDEPARRAFIEPDKKSLPMSCFLH
ncbi:hypothetical protein HZU77_012480 [Neisseriaceae bacterium TC5R-5]|nr:hypothetical protein [Neisseriaceae bacterium TC5R-5]